MPAFSVPTGARLPPSLRIPSTDPVARKILARLSRASLSALAIRWVDDSEYLPSRPYLDSPGESHDTDDFYPPASSLEQLRLIYSQLQARKGSKKEVLERVMDGDWRHGLTLHQLAMAELQHLYDHPTSHRWSAHRILPLESATPSSDENALGVDKKSLTIPRIRPSTFLEHFHSHVLPDAKAHIQFDRPPSLRMVILRILMIDSPYNTNLALLNGDDRGLSSALSRARTVYVAFPDNTPFLYISNLVAAGPPNPAETRNLRTLISEGIRRALSRPQERYTLVSSGITTRNLRALVHFRGPSRSNAAGGGWSIYAKESTLESPLDTTAQSDSSPKVSGNVTKRPRSVTAHWTGSDKRAKLIARARFGDSAKTSDDHGLERVKVVLEDPFSIAPSRGIQGGEHLAGTSTSPLSSRWSPNVKITMQGPHVFAGLRQLVEGGIIDGERMPGWLTGEENVTAGTIRNGRMRTHRTLEL